MITAEVENRKPAWIGDFPSHWKVIRIRNLFREIDDRSVNGDGELLSVSQYTGVTPKRDSLENEDDFISNAETLENYKKVAIGDLVINIMLAWNGSLGISPYEGITSPAYCVYRCLPGNNPEYFGYLFSTALFKVEFRRNSTGIIDSRLRLYSDKFFSIFSVVPPIEEQNRIVEYIKIQSEKINRFIVAKKRFIELLKEQRQGIIDHAVIKGIISNASTKFSGYDWLGDIPEHWELRRLKFCIESKLKYGANESGYEFDPSWYRYIRITDFNTEGDLSEDNKLSLPIEKAVEFELADGDILFARSGATVGKTFIFRSNDDDEKYCFAGYLIKATPRKEIILSEYLYNFTNSIAFENWKNRIFIKATIENIGANKYASLFVPIPPISEQSKILEYIVNETSIINTAISKAEQEIELIKEYKEAMIAEAVMGKVT